MSPFPVLALTLLTPALASAPLILLQDVPARLLSGWHMLSANLLLFIFTRWAQCQALSWYLCPQCLPATVASLSYLGQGAFLLNRIDLPDGRKTWAIFLFPAP